MTTAIKESKKALLKNDIKGIGELVKEVTIENGLVNIEIKFIENEVLRNLFQDYVFNTTHNILIAELNSNIIGYDIKTNSIEIKFQ